MIWSNRNQGEKCKAASKPFRNICSIGVKSLYPSLRLTARNRCLKVFFNRIHVNSLVYNTTECYSINISLPNHHFQKYFGYQNVCFRRFSLKMLKLKDQSTKNLLRK